MTTVEAISAITALTTLAVRSAEAVQRISILIQQAQSEGRDLTDDEAAAIRDMRAQAVRRWDEAGGQ